VSALPTATRAPAACGARSTSLPSRPGAVLTAVAGVLEGGGRPMSVAEIHAAISSLADAAVPRSSVNAALSSHCRGPSARFRRIRFGVYALNTFGLAEGSLTSAR